MLVDASALSPGSFALSTPTVTEPRPSASTFDTRTRLGLPPPPPNDPSSASTFIQPITRPTSTGVAPPLVLGSTFSARGSGPSDPSSSASRTRPSEKPAPRLPISLPPPPVPPRALNGTLSATVVSGGDVQSTFSNSDVLHATRLRSRLQGLEKDLETAERAAARHFPGAGGERVKARLVAQVQKLEEQAARVRLEYQTALGQLHASGFKLNPDLPANIEPEMLAINAQLSHLMGQLATVKLAEYPSSQMADGDGPSDQQPTGSKRRRSSVASDDHPMAVDWEAQQRQPPSVQHPLDHPSARVEDRQAHRTQPAQDWVEELKTLQETTKELEQKERAGLEALQRTWKDILDAEEQAQAVAKNITKLKAEHKRECTHLTAAVAENANLVAQLEELESSSTLEAVVSYTKITLIDAQAALGSQPCIEYTPPQFFDRIRPDVEKAVKAALRAQLDENARRVKEKLETHQNSWRETARERANCAFKLTNTLAVFAARNGVVSGHGGR